MSTGKREAMIPHLVKRLHELRRRALMLRLHSGPDKGRQKDGGGSVLGSFLALPEGASRPRLPVTYDIPESDFVFA
jgi:hypothetical protein